MDTSHVYTGVNADKLSVGDLVIAADSWAGLQEAVRDNEVPAMLTGVLGPDFSKRFETHRDIGRQVIHALAYLVCPKRNAEAYEAWHNGASIEFEYNGTWQTYTGDGEPTWTDYDFRPASRHYVRIFDGDVKMFVHGTSDDPAGRYVYFAGTEDECHEWCTARNKHGLAKYASAREAGKTVQWRGGSVEDWTEYNLDDFDPAFEYRVKPEEYRKTYRPFNDLNELFTTWAVLSGRETLSRMELPCIWVKYNAQCYLISHYDTADMYNPMRINGQWVSMQELLRSFTFLDGTPCGVEE